MRPRAISGTVITDLRPGAWMASRFSPGGTAASTTSGVITGTNSARPVRSTAATPVSSSGRAGKRRVRSSGDRDPGGVGMGDRHDLDAVLGRDADAAPVGQARHREARERGEGGAGAEGGVEHHPGLGEELLALGLALLELVEPRAVERLPETARRSW